MRKKLVAGNWKMNGSLRQNEVLLSDISAAVPELTCEVAVFPPYPYLAQSQLALASSGVALGAQSVSEYTQGAFTGEVSASMLAEFGCRYVLLGHSERRGLFGETDAVVAAKFEAAQKAGLIPVLCLGETLAERESGNTMAVVARQLSSVLDRSGVGAMVSAVVHAAIRAQVAVLDVGVAEGLRILYGGSVKPQNAEELFGQADIDGGLIGGAALVADDFLKICLAAS